MRYCYLFYKPDKSYAGCYNYASSFVKQYFTFIIRDVVCVSLDCKMNNLFALDSEFFIFIANVLSVRYTLVSTNFVIRWKSAHATFRTLFFATSATSSSNEMLKLLSSVPLSRCAHIDCHWGKRSRSCIWPVWGWEWASEWENVCASVCLNVYVSSGPSSSIKSIFIPNTRV